MKILQWNLENLYLEVQNLPPTETSDSQWQSQATSGVHKNKALPKLEMMAEVFLKENADVAVLCEVVGIESLRNFNKFYLQDQYEIFMLDSNSRRGIDIAFLVKKERSFECRVVSNKDHKLTPRHKERMKFSRDIPELHILEDGVLKLAIFGVHLKSKQTSGDDFFGVETRYTEVKGLVELVNKHSVPVIVAGDFNGWVQEHNHEFEFEDIFVSTNLTDFHDILNLDKDRTTFVRVDPLMHNQLDYILVDRKIKDLIDPASGVVRYTGFYDIVLEHPKTMREKNQLPSDHYPQALILKKLS